MKLSKYVCAMVLMLACGCTSSVSEDCSDSADCGSGEYCAFEKGSCGDAAGVCEAIPDACTLDFSPVCGCDGKTYSNDCTAASAGMSVASDGACEEDICCDAATAPGVGDNPTCVEGASCCGDGEWQCNSGAGLSSCDEAGTPCEVDEICCTEAEEPGFGDNPICVEGATCCGDGEWKCNNGDGSSSCDEAGTACKADGASRPKQPSWLSDEGRAASLE